MVVLKYVICSVSSQIDGENKTLLWNHSTLWVVTFSRISECKDCCNGSYIGETSRLLDIRLKEHCEADKITKARAFTLQHRKSSQTEGYKSAIAEHATIENHMLNWDNVTKLEQVPDWRMRGIKDALAIRSTPHKFNHSQRERHIFPHVWDPLLSSCPGPDSDNTGW